MLWLTLNEKKKSSVKYFSFTTRNASKNHLNIALTFHNNVRVLNILLTKYSYLCLRWQMFMIANELSANSIRFEVISINGSTHNCPLSIQQYSILQTVFSCSRSSQPCCVKHKDSISSMQFNFKSKSDPIRPFFL